MGDHMYPLTAEGIDPQPTITISPDSKLGCEVYAPVNAGILTGHSASKQKSPTQPSRLSTVSEGQVPEGTPEMEPVPAPPPSTPGLSDAFDFYLDQVHNIPDDATIIKVRSKYFYIFYRNIAQIL